MNEYRFSDLCIGQKAEFSVRITQSMMESFCIITGDINPLHVDTTYAQNNGYKTTVCYGMLTSSFYSTLVGVYLPGKYCLLQSCNTSFHLPVFVGDVLTISGIIVEVHEVFQHIKIKAKIRNQNGTRVSRATIGVGVMPEERN